MPRSQILRRKHVKKLNGCDHSEQASVGSKTHEPQNCGKHSEPLASSDPEDHDSVPWLVTDDWPEQVPITTAEVETIEAFLQEVIDDLFR
jgi:hypothetical protein